jgi:hypothetical protein
MLHVCDINHAGIHTDCTDSRTFDTSDNHTRVAITEMPVDTVGITDRDCSYHRVTLQDSPAVIAYGSPGRPVLKRQDYRMERRHRPEVVLRAVM